MIKKSVRKPLFDKSSDIKVKKTKGDKSNKRAITYLKSRYSLHYKKNNWKRAEEYNKFSKDNFQFDLRDWFEKKEQGKIKNKNVFGFDKPKKINYG